MADELTGGAELVEIYCTTALVGMHLRDAAKGDVLRVAWWTGDGYQMVDKVVGEDFSLDTVHVSAGEVYMEVDGQEYALKLRNGKLVLWYTAGRKIVYIQPHAIGNMEEVIAMRNDSYVYGAHPFYNVEAVDFAAFPETYAEMLAQVDSTNWAVVNNPNMSATKTLWNWGEECYLIGVIDDFYMIMDTDENVRYIPQDWLWAGNG